MVWCIEWRIEVKRWRIAGAALCVYNAEQYLGPIGATETIMTHIRLDQASFIVPQGHINLVAVTKYWL